MKKTQRALIVEDNDSLANTLGAVASEFSESVEIALGVQEAKRAILASVPDLVLLDYALPDGNASGVLDALREAGACARIIVITGEAQSEESFRLAQRGVRGFLRKPCSLTRLKKTIESVLEVVPDPIPEVRAAVGQRSIDEIEGNVRQTMVEEAMRRSDGNVRAAARLLGVSRQRLQYILRSQVPKSAM